jgi:PPOX class probable F420-dependent enzyme
VPETKPQMSTAQIEAFLDESRHAIAAVIGADGVPRLSPIWFLYEDERLYFTTLLTSAKYRALRRDPRISLCIDAGHPDARAVCIRGRVQLIDDSSDEYDDLHWRIVRRYYESDREAERWMESVAEEGPSALVVVSPERIFGWDYN